MLEEQDVTSVVGGAEGAPAYELSPLAQRLDALATWLYWVAGLVLACAFVSGLIALSTNADTFGQVETDGRVAVALALIAGGFAGAGIVAGLAGILKALVRRREL